MMLSFLFLIFLFTAKIVLAEPSATLFLDDPASMEKLESQGLSLAQILTGDRKLNNSELYATSAYKSFVDVVAQDLDQMQLEDKHLGPTMVTKHRLFHKGWLSSKSSFYELVGVSTRLDRAPFHSDPRYQCGEVRLIYRLAYQKKHLGEDLYSRLPLTLNLVFWAVDREGKGSVEKCQSIAQSWKLAGDAVSAVVTKKAQFDKKNLKSLELNLQAVRWPSTVRPDFGGYAEYLMRVFRLDQQSGTFSPAVMENMIDAAKLKKNTSLKKELLAFLKNPSNAKKFDEGIGTVPDKFLSLKAISVAFHGIARLANRPYDQVLSADDFKGLDLSSQTYVKTADAYLRRLNDMSCVGCHQSRAVAGFHFVGVDKAQTFAANAVKMARSGHLQLDLIRRQKLMQNFIEGKTADLKRGFSERLETEEGSYGAHCSLGQDISFKGWTCETGLKCQSIDTATTNKMIGVCLPEKNQFAGDPCDVGRVSQNSDGRKDQVVQKAARACREGHSCFQASDGFPGGLCYEFCKDVRAGEGCGLIAFNGFNPCLGQNKPFTTCLKEFTGDMTLKSCDTENPCRDDFICARTKSDTGVCIPPYFLFQLRVDGHPSP